MSIQKIIDKYKSKASFNLMYIREAHPSDGRRPDKQTDIKDPTSWEERQKVAQICVDALKLNCDTWVDDMKDTANKSYSAKPERLAVIDKDGKVAFISGPGPWGFKPEELDKFLEKFLK